jgi:hypothetical protein
MTWIFLIVAKVLNSVGIVNLCSTNRASLACLYLGLPGVSTTGTVYIIEPNYDPLLDLLGPGCTAKRSNSHSRDKELSMLEPYRGAMILATMFAVAPGHLRSWSRTRRGSIFGWRYGSSKFTVRLTKLQPDFLVLVKPCNSIRRTIEVPQSTFINLSQFTLLEAHLRSRQAKYTRPDGANPGRPSKQALRADL